MDLLHQVHDSCGLDLPSICFWWGNRY